MQIRLVMVALFASLLGGAALPGDMRAQEAVIDGSQGRDAELAALRVELKLLRAQQAKQQVQIDALLAEREQAGRHLSPAEPAARGDSPAAGAPDSSRTAPAATAVTLPAPAANAGSAGAAMADGPPELRYKGVHIKPVGFFALEGVYRTRALNAGINTPFNATPFPGSNQGHISEFNLSARQSRLGSLFEGEAGGLRLSGYVEADFLSAGVTSNENQSNSYTLRERQVWGRLQTRSGFALTGGQMWSLASENSRSIAAGTEKLPGTIDPQYLVGFTWERQPGLRVEQRLARPVLGAQVTLAAAVENAQTQLAISANAPPNFIVGGAGLGGGLFNAFSGNYANSLVPDLIVKAAFDGRHAHAELGGLVRVFRDAFSPLAAGSATAIADPGVLLKDTKAGGGVFGSVRLLSRRADLAVQAMGGSGTARYGSSQLGDVTVRPDGTLAPIRNVHGLVSLETRPGRRFDLNAYYGVEYNQRTVFTGPSGLLTGYGVRNADDSGCYARTIGSPTPDGNSGAAATVGACTSPTRAIQQAALAYTYRLVDSPRYGRLQYEFTYSYLMKSTWSGLLSPAAGLTGEGRATNNLVHGSLRYYIP